MVSDFPLVKPQVVIVGGQIDSRLISYHIKPHYSEIKIDIINSPGRTSAAETLTAYEQVFTASVAQG